MGNGTQRGKWMKKGGGGKMESVKMGEKILIIWKCHFWTQNYGTRHQKSVYLATNLCFFNYGRAAWGGTFVIIGKHDEQLMLPVPLPPSHFAVPPGANFVFFFPPPPRLILFLEWLIPSIHSFFVPWHSFVVPSTKINKSTDERAKKGGNVKET